MADEKIILQMTGGPSKLDFMNSLFEGGSAQRKYVLFTFEHEGVSAQYSVALSSAEREDGSGNNWIFKGYANKLVCPNAGPLSTLSRFGKISEINQRLFGATNGSLFGVHGYFNTQTRRGWIAPGYDFPKKIIAFVTP